MHTKLTLTLLDKETLRYLACGFTADDIADTTHYSFDGIKSRMSRLYRAIGAVNAPNAVALGHAYEFLGPLPVDVPTVEGQDIEIIRGYALGKQRGQIAAELSLTIPILEYRKKVIRREWGTANPAAMVDTAHHAGLIEHIPQRNYRQ